MKDIELKSFRELKLEDKNVLDCIRNPVAYASTILHPTNYNKYFMMLYYYDTWDNKNEPFIKRQNRILSNLKLEMKEELCESKDAFVDAVRRHIDQDESVFIFVDYYHMFYNKSYYKRQHIPHGILITGYDETNHTLGLRERIIIEPDGLYYFQLTEDMVYDLWSNSCESRNREKKIYSIRKNTAYANLAIEDILQQIYLDQEDNYLIDYIRNYDKEFSETDGFFLRRHYNATAYLFELIQDAVVLEDLKTEVTEFRKEYLAFLNLFVSTAIRNMVAGGGQNRMEKQFETLKEWDHRFFSLIGRVSAYFQNARNIALGCKVTTSSMVVADIPYSGEKTVNGKYSDADMMQNHWVSNDTDKNHWITYDFGKKRPIWKVVLYHVKCNMLVDYIIQGSNDSQQWDDLYKVVYNQEGISSYYLKGQSYRYLRVYITNPSLYGTAARLLEFQAWA